MYTPLHTRVYTHRLTPVYTRAHGSRHACIPRPICTPSHTHISTDTKLHVYIQTVSRQVHTFAYRTTFKDANACLYAPLHTQSHRLPTAISAQQSRIHRQTLGFQPPGWLSLPSLSLPSPTPMTGSKCSCQPQCLPSASRPPGVPRSLINPLANWPPAP